MRARRHGTSSADRPRGLPERLRSFGWTALFAAGLAAVALVGGEDFALEAFRGASGSQATLDAVDVGARGALYLRGLVAFALTGLVVAALGGPFARLVGRRDAGLFDALSIVGVTLLVAKLYGASVRAPLAIVLALQAGLFAVAALDRLRGRDGPHPERAAYLAWLAAVAFGLATLSCGALSTGLPAGLRAGTAGIAAFVACGVLLHAVVLVLARGASGDRWLFALTPLAYAAGVAPLALELALELDGAGLAEVQPQRVGLVLVGLLGAWCALRFARGPGRWRALGEGGRCDGRLALEDLVARRVLPGALVTAIVFTWYLPIIPISKDLAEPGNAGLSIQQLFEYGRLPFLETFDGHGLTGSGFGFLYAGLTGLRDETWQFFDFMEPALAALIVYQVVRRLAHSPYAALGVVLLLPARDALFPEYCVFALTGVFVLRFALQRDTLRAWALLVLYAFGAIMWRIDIGFASGAAMLVVLISVSWSADGWRPGWGRALRGGLVAGTLLAALYLALCLARGLDPLAVLRRLLHIVGSNQAWGYSKVAPTLDAVARTYLFVVPLAVLGALVVWLARTRRALPRPRAEHGRLDTPRGSPHGVGLHAWIVVVFGAAYFFANYPRGIVRHSFMEQGNVYIASFAPLVLCSIAFWGGRPSSTRFAAFVLGATFLAALVPPGQPDRGRSASSRVAASLLERMSAYPTFPRGGRPIDRSPLPGNAGLRHANELLDFLDSNLAPHETFFDLSFSPMLYVLGHRRSPGYLNHLILAHDEFLQRDALADLERAEAPLALVGQEPANRRRADVPRWNTIDGVAASLRQPLLFEHAQSAYRPLAAVGRWYVWARDGWGLATAPPARSSRTLARWSASEGAWPGRLAAGAAGTVAMGSARVVRVLASAAAAGRVEVVFEFDNGMRDARALELEPGVERWLVVPDPTPDARLVALELDQARLVAELELAQLEDPAWRPIEHAARAPRLDDLEALPRIVAELGMPELREQAALATLFEMRAEGDVELALRALTSGAWRNGVHTRKAAVALTEVPLGLARGGRLRFAAAGERRVERIDGPRVWLDGEALDPERDGAPAAATWTGRRPRRLAVSVDEPAVFALAPLQGARAAVFLMLELRQTEMPWIEVLVTYHGEGRPLGSFLFRAERDERVRTYAVRLSTQYNWLVQSVDRIELAPRYGAFELERARLVRAAEEAP